MVPPVLLSVNVGLPKNVAWQGKTVYTGAWKHPVDGPAIVRRLNIDGDGQGDLAGHGGEQRAVLVYQAGSYRHWQQHFGRDDLGYGSFGENLTVDGLADESDAEVLAAVVDGDPIVDFNAADARIFDRFADSSACPFAVIELCHSVLGQLIDGVVA